MNRETRTAILTMLRDLERLPPRQRVIAVFTASGIDPGRIAALAGMVEPDYRGCVGRVRFGGLALPFLGAGLRRAVQREQERLARPPRGRAVPGLRPAALWWWLP